MKKYYNRNSIAILLVFILSFSFRLYAKEIRITFQSVGVKSSYDSVLVLNQNTNAEVKLLNSQQLILIDTLQKLPTTHSGEVEMVCNENDQLVYKAFSGKNTTIIIDTPKKSKLVLLNFIECVDIDGNHYAVVKIGTQWWMAENLRVTKYNNGDLIPNMISSESWRVINTGAQCSYLNSENYDTLHKYGRLYNWFAVSDKRKLAPKGWHVPSDKEFIVLETYVSYNLGNSTSTPKALASSHDWNKYRKIGTIGKNMEQNNSSGFTAMPGGFRSYSNGKFLHIVDYGYFWSSSENQSQGAWVRGLDFRSDIIAGGNGCKLHGYSVRCIKNK